MSARGVTTTAVTAFLVLSAGCGSALSATDGGTGDATPDPRLSPREAVVSAQWKAPGAVVLKGRGSDTPRTHLALRIMDDDPPLLDRPASHLRAVLGRPRTVLHHNTTWRYRISVRARPHGESCTRYFTVVLYNGRVDGYEIDPESCTDGSPGRDLPTR
jgi:hypothetical protein